MKKYTPEQFDEILRKHKKGCKLGVCGLAGCELAGCGLGSFLFPVVVWLVRFTY